MTFSLISIAVFLITALVIVIEVLRAIHRGRNKTLVTLASILLSVFLSIFVTRFFSKLLAGRVLSFIKSIIDVTKLSERFASAEDILFAFSDSLVAPVLFLLIFILVRILVAIVIKIVYISLKTQDNDELYENEDAPEYKTNPNVVNGLLGALCGFIVMIVAISPVMGSVKMTAKTFKNMNSDTRVFDVRIKENIVLYFDRCSDDIVGNIVYYCGGNLVYKAVATSDLNDNYFGLENEIDNTFAYAGDLLSMNNVLNHIDSATEEEKDMLRKLGDNVDKAETLKSATADVLPILSRKWLNDESYEGVKRPKVSKACSSFFDKMLYVCKSSTPDTVGADLSTLLNVYLIAYENDILHMEDYKEMIETAKRTGAFELIKKELNKNPRMAGISVDIDTMGLKSISTALKNFNFENYETLMTDITAILNDAISRNGQDRLDYVVEYTKKYINQYGIDVGDDVVNEVSKRLIEELVDHKKTVTVDELKSFWDKYALDSKAPTEESENAPPSTEPPMQSITPETDPEGDLSSGEDEGNNEDLGIEDGLGDEIIGDVGGENNNDGNMADDYFVDENNGYYAVG